MWFKYKMNSEFSSVKGKVYKFFLRIYRQNLGEKVNLSLGFVDLLGYRLFFSVRQGVCIKMVQFVNIRILSSNV